MKQVFGGILLAVGILIAGASGLCSIMVLVGKGEMAGLGMFTLVLVFGGIPIVVGVLVAFAGRRLIRQAREERGDIDDISDRFK